MITTDPVILAEDTGPTPSDLVYDDMTAAWRDDDHALAWHLADVLLQYLASDGKPLTFPRHRYFADQIHAYYALDCQPASSGRPEHPVTLEVRLS